MEINKYSNGKIYQIVSFSHPELVYYGSTVQPLSNRMCAHRCSFKAGYNTSSKFIVCFDDATILLVENYPCNNKEELNRREGEYIKNNECVNKVIAGRNINEWKEDNRAITNQKAKIYHKRPEILEKAKLRYAKEKITDEYITKQKQHYIEKKEDILLRQCEEITCICGCKFQKNNKNIHMKSAKHNKLMNKEELIKKIIIINEIQCECGSVFKNIHLKKHLNCNSHKYFLEQNKKLVIIPKVIYEQVVCDCGCKLSSHCLKRHKKSKDFLICHF
jgi:hypothetical protein